MKKNEASSFLTLYDKTPFSKHVNETLLSLARTNQSLSCIFQIGTSLQHTPIMAFKIGHGPIKILIHGTHHAREAITTILLLDQIQHLLTIYKKGNSVDSISSPAIFEELSFFFVPLVNPDGADLALSNDTYQAWKANIRGVDLNENYPTAYPSDFLTEKPGPNGYPGTHFFSEPETYALKELTEEERFHGTISYHSSGQEIYWYYNQKELSRDETIAKLIAQVTGYELLTASPPAHGSGYKDWFIESYHCPALTIEVAPYIGDKPVPASYYEHIWKKNKNVPLLFGCAVNNYLLS
ncbi:gamma-D-glutamyl-L-diamino acid endopeptidase I [Lachnospiraceae bacterium KM106-2]|nr:gamma-D-glutamyl-L-diamino acid endopeptidase I [Lachnospiraceae bacterium KM106-2]